MPGRPAIIQRHGWGGAPLPPRPDAHPATAGHGDQAGFERLVVAAVVASAGAVRYGFAVLRAWRERAWQRRQLAGLDDRLLRDIGLTRADVDDEIRKPFWRP